MPPPRIVFDGLRRCLCPSFDSRLLATFTDSPIQMQRGPVAATCRRRIGPRSRCLSSQTHQSPSRSYATTATTSSKQSHQHLGRTEGVSGASQGHDPSPSLQIPDEPPTARYSPSKSDELLRKGEPSTKVLSNTPVDVILGALQRIRDPSWRAWHNEQIDIRSRIHLLVRHLCDERGIPQDRFLYECMMDYVVDHRGSASEMFLLLQDMQKNLRPTATFCKSALMALTVHSSPAFRAVILEIMREHWFDLDLSDKQNIVIGLLRDSQLELAYAELEKMIGEKLDIQPWVYDVFIMVFGRNGIFDEMTELLHRRLDLDFDHKVLPGILFYTLDVCSQACHYHGTKFAWEHGVQGSLIQPPDGVLDNVLFTAARHGDTEFATAVHDLIAQRTKVFPYHYEALLDAFASDGDISKVFDVLSIMEHGGHKVDRNTTRGIYQALQQRPGLLGEAERSLREFRERGSPVPIGAVSVTVEAISAKFGSEAAMPLYRDTLKLSGKTSEHATIQDLIVNCKGQRLLAAELISDYKANQSFANEPPRSQDTYHKLITRCAEMDELDLAFHFAKLATAHLPDTATGPPTWLAPLFESASKAQDGRIFEYVDRVKVQHGEDAQLLRAMKKSLLEKRLASRVGGPGGSTVPNKL